MPKNETIGNVHFSEYTVSELAALAGQALPTANAKHLSECDPSGHMASWMGGIRSWDDARAVLDNGWAEGAHRAMTIKDQLESASAMPKVRRRRRQGVWGRKGKLNVERALSGQWDIAYRGHKRRTVAGVAKCITLTVGWGGNCGKSAEAMFWSGAVMLVLCDMLTTAGFSVKLNAVSKVRSNADRTKLIMKRVVIKDHGEPVRPDALAGIVCHAGIYRSYGFLASCMAPWDIGSGLGQSKSWAEANAMIKALPVWYEANEVIVKDCYSKADAVREAQAVLTRFKAA